MTGERLLSGAAVAAIVAFGLSAEARLSPTVVAAYAAAVYFGSALQLPAPSRVVQAALRLLALVASAGAALVTVLARQVPIIPEATGREWAGVLGFTLTGLVTAGVLTRRSLGRPRFLVPTAVALLVTAGLGYSRPDFASTTRVPLHYLVPSAAAAVLLWAWAVASGGPRPSRRGLLTFFGTAAAIAVFLLVFLPLAQPHVERAVAAALADGATGLDEGTSLGDVASLAQSDRVVLRVWTSRPQLLRAFVLDRFDGRGWTAAKAARRTLPPLDTPPPALLRGASGSYFLLPPFGPEDLAGAGGAVVGTVPAALVETRLVPAVSDGWPLVAPASPVLVRAPLRWLERSESGVLRASEVPALYGVASRPGAAREPSPTADARRLPPVDPRVRALASSLAEGAGSDREKLDRTVAHLHGGGYRYTLAVGSFRTADPLAEFLFDKRAGYCEYFATAAAVLLRLQGVPARFVKGLSVGPHNEAAGHYVVRDRDAHAWVEAWLPGAGWVEADPTPPRDFAALHPPRPLAGVAEWLEGLRAATAQAWALLSAGEWRELASRTAGALGRSLQRLLTTPPAAAAVAIALAAAGFWRHRRRRGRRPASRPLDDAPAVSPELRALLQRLDRLWASAGAARPPARALLEHVQRLPPTTLPAAALDTSRRVIDAYYRAAFAGRPADAVATARLSAELAALERSRP